MCLHRRRTFRSGQLTLDWKVIDARAALAALAATTSAADGSQRGQRANGGSGSSPAPAPRKAAHDELRAHLNGWRCCVPPASCPP